ncbi:MAG: response regulator transcription factor [Gammaproteobacteria bacterium]|nr:response regulator transcription factor [Gammaproteobacteria bacterium]
MHRILLIDDDERLAGPLKTYFERFELELVSATHPEDGLGVLNKNNIDLVILDVMLPDMDGFEVCRTIRKTSDIPVIMLTARGEVTDRVVGLEIGADDYLPKPFEPRELVARIHNVLKRTRSSGSAETKLEFSRLGIDLDQRQVWADEQVLNLTTTEYQLLVLLAQQPGKNFTRDDILNQLKGIDAEIYSRSVDIQISRLRQKLKPLDCIKTVWGSGYTFIEPKA